MERKTIACLALIFVGMLALSGVAVATDLCHTGAPTESECQSTAGSMARESCQGQHGSDYVNCYMDAYMAAYESCLNPIVMPGCTARPAAR